MINTMGLFSALFSSPYQTKADCDKRIAKIQEQIANLKASIASAKGIIAQDKAYNRKAGHTVFSYDGIENKMNCDKARIEQLKAEIAKIRGVKAGLPK